MDIEQIWSAALGALALLSTTLAGNRRRSAWQVGILAQLGWIGFMFLTENFGFIVSIVGFTVVYIRNYIAWAPDQQPEQFPRSCTCTAAYPAQ